MVYIMINKKVYIFIIIALFVSTLSFFGGILSSGYAKHILTAMGSNADTFSEGSSSEDPYYINSKSSSLLKEANLIAEIVEKAGPAVVNIDVVKMQKTTFMSPFSDFENFFGFGTIDPQFRRFFEEKMIPIKGSGSGFIINKNGYILTNEHVIGSADKIKVTLKDGRSFNAKVIGSDAMLDLAVIKIDAGSLPIVKLGNSEKLRPGQWVIAIGNPYQFSNTVTAGIISALGRDLEDIGKHQLIQTDAAINPGNSGGPLINLAGEVIGVNVAIAAGAHGIGFAIPINDVKDILNDLIKKGKVVRPWLGVYMRDVDEKIAGYLDLPFAEGVVITEVSPNSPASTAGLRKYDVIKEIDGKKMSSSSDIQKLIRDRKPGAEISLLIFRDGHNVKIAAALGEAPR